jgi:hypothetical protein
MPTKKDVQEMDPDKSWIIEVLSQIKDYAVESELPVLAEQLDEVAIIAMVEIAQRTDEGGGAVTPT